MKTACFFVIMLIFSCTLVTRNKNEIAGTYARIAENEIYILHDTLILSPVSKQANHEYRIIQRSQTNFKNPTEQKFNKRAKHFINGTYDPQTGIMKTDDPGRLYSFDPKETTITINEIIYRKIK
ncbi:hypothetical protein LQ567_16610 [Niabella pedocola]|uniref:Lipoprotein n=1 Tax=Niabella pedocola TaxID=1752077 RepID=A0ABS8PTK6_9BACT|nr:hypothetical protein [Niabella pedocola]MCD2424404.1 hypothetical protein [Niabella pedocola]